MLDNEERSLNKDASRGPTETSLQPTQTPSTLLPKPIASFISLATATSSYSLRFGSAIGNAAISGARLGTLTGFEVGRLLLEVILVRAGQDVLDSSTGQLGRAAAETLLDRALNSLHSVITQTSFLVSAGFQIGSISLASSVALSQYIISAINAILGDTETSKAIATIISIIQRESRNSEAGINGEQLSISDLFVGVIGFALLQRWCALETERELFESDALHQIWDIVVLDNEQRNRDDFHPTSQTSTHDLEQPDSPSSEDSTGLVYTPREQDIIGDFRFNEIDSLASVPSTRPNSSGHGQSIAEGSLHEHVSSQLKPGSSVQITSERVVTDTLKIDISGDTSPQVEPPNGFSLLSVEQTSQSKSLGKRRFIFQRSKKRTRRGSFEVESVQSSTAPSPAIESPERVVDLTDLTEQSLEEHNTSHSRATREPSIYSRETPRVMANEKRPRQYAADSNEKQHLHSYDSLWFEANEAHNAIKDQMRNNQRMSFKQAIRRNASVKNLVDFWSRDRPQGIERISSSHTSKPDAGKELLASSRRGSIQSSPNTSTLLPSSRSRVRSHLDQDSSQQRGNSPERSSLGYDRKHRRGSSSIFTIASNMSETSVILHPSPIQDESEMVSNALRREGHLPGAYPRYSFARNVARFARFSVASYGSNFIRFMGITPETTQLGRESSDNSQLAQHQSFSAYSRLPAHTVLLSSFVDPEGGTNSAGETETGMPLVHYVCVDHESKAVVLACRGTLGFEDVLTDMSCDYDDIVWGNRTYQVHKGMHASARRMLTVNNGRIVATIKAALEEFDDYGFVLCGHSLGGGVTALLAILLAEPNTKSAGGYSKFVTASPTTRLQNEVYNQDRITFLPPNRPIHVYTYGPAAVLSPSLQRATRGLITTVVNDDDLVPYLSLGVLRDVKSVALTFKTDDNDAKGEVRRRVWGSIAKAFRDKTGLSGTWDSISPEWASGNDEDNDDHWPQAALKSLRAGMMAPKLMPPGEIFIIKASPILQRHAFVDNATATSSSTPSKRMLGQDSSRHSHSYNPGTNIKLTHVRDVETRFREPRFHAGLFAGHIPARYERALTALEQGLCP